MERLYIQLEERLTTISSLLPSLPPPTPEQAHDFHLFSRVEPTYSSFTSFASFLKWDYVHAIKTMSKSVSGGPNGIGIVVEVLQEGCEKRSLGDVEEVADLLGWCKGLKAVVEERIKMEVEGDVDASPVPSVERRARSRGVSFASPLPKNESPPAKKHSKRSRTNTPPEASDSDSDAFHPPGSNGSQRMTRHCRSTPPYRPPTRSQSSGSLVIDSTSRSTRGSGSSNNSRQLSGSIVWAKYNDSFGWWPGMILAPAVAQCKWFWKLIRGARHLKIDPDCYLIKWLPTGIYWRWVPSAEVVPFTPSLPIIGFKGPALSPSDKKEWEKARSIAEDVGAFAKWASRETEDEEAERKAYELRRKRGEVEDVVVDTDEEVGVGGAV